MTDAFDGDAIAKLGWRQGAVLGVELAARAREHHASRPVSPGAEEWLIVTSHDCDIVNPSLAKEPVVEVLCATVLQTGTMDRQQSSGRNPRKMHLAVERGEGLVVISCSIHDRWFVPRDLLLRETPALYLPDKERRLVAEWLAKRYIRAAFPTAFDLRWRSKLKDWQRILRANSEWIQGVYLRLSTFAELPEEEQYVCHLLVAVPHEKRTGADWPNKRDELEQEMTTFWNQFKPGIECAEVEPLGTDEITLADIEPYQRIDADWVSFDDETPSTPTHIDMPL